MPYYRKWFILYLLLKILIFTFYFSCMTSASLLKKKLEMLNRCGLCCRKLRDPRSLPCQHMFCAVCLRSKYRRNSDSYDYYDGYDDDSDDGLIRCETCSKRFECPAGGVDKLPKSFLMETLLKADSLDKYCTSHRNMLIVAYCFDCAEAVCSICRIQHTAEHDVVPKERGLDRVYQHADVELARLESLNAVSEHFNRMKIENKLFDNEADRVTNKVKEKADQIKSQIKVCCAELVLSVNDLKNKGIGEFSKHLMNVDSLYSDVMLSKSIAKNCEHKAGLRELVSDVSSLKILTNQLVQQQQTRPTLYEYKPPKFTFVIAYDCTGESALADHNIVGQISTGQCFTGKMNSYLALFSGDFAELSQVSTAMSSLGFLHICPIEPSLFHAQAVNHHPHDLRLVFPRVLYWDLGPILFILYTTPPP